MNVLYKDLIALITEKEKQYALRNKKQRYRLKFHLMPPLGWLNDPNGLCQYQGRYHVFFQYSPFDVKGGIKTWGHYSSKDMIHWEYQGVPLVPDQPFDCHGVYSGSALIDKGKMELYYTGNVKYDGDFDYILTGRGANTIRVVSEDGEHFGRKQLLLENRDYPSNYTCHIRDPKVWKDKDCYRMVLGARKKEEKGSILLYKSKDKSNWDFSKEISTKEPFGFMWECPDIFELDGAAILSVSPQGLASEEYRFQNLYQSGYFMIRNMVQKESSDLKRKDIELADVSMVCEEETNVSVCEEDFYEWDMGFDFYAPQTFQDEKGRRILIGWAGMPDVEEEYDNQPTIEEGWQHALTVPRQLKRKGKRVFQYPVEELLMLRGESHEISENQSDAIENQMFDLEIENLEEKELCVHINQDFYFQYHKQEQVAEISFHGTMGQGRSVRKAKVETVTNVRILADTSLMEIYLNYGEIVFTTRYYSKENMILTIEKGGTKNTIWDINAKQPNQANS